MSAYVLIITLAMSSYDGGVAVTSVPFATKDACEAAARIWNGRNVGHMERTQVKASCHATGTK